MIWTGRLWLSLAAISGMVGVAAGAFAAHGVVDPRAKDLMSTAAHYQSIHALAVFACATVIQAGGGRARLAPALFLAGTLLFSGSLYALAVGAPRWAGAITPVGGGLFLAGWGMLAWAAASIDRIAIGTRP